MFTDIIIDNSNFPLSDKVIFPSDILVKLCDSKSYNLFDHSQPLLIELHSKNLSCNKIINKSVVGIREFSLKNEKSIVIPWCIGYKLGILNETDVMIDYKIIDDVDNGSFVQLEPLGEIYWENLINNPQNYEHDNVDRCLSSDFVNNEFLIKTFLEARWNNTITSLTAGENLLISVEENGMVPHTVYKFKIHDLKPSTTVCVVNTDIQLDIIRSNRIPIDSNGHMIIKNDLSQTPDYQGGMDIRIITLNKIVTVLPHEKIVYKIDGLKEFQLEILDNDLDESFQILFGEDDLVSSTSFFSSTMRFSSKFIKSDQFINTITNIVHEGPLYLLPHFVSNPLLKSYKFKLKIKDFEIVPDSQDVKECKYCKELINEYSFVLHELHCSRATHICKICDAVFYNVKTISSSHWHCDHGDIIFNGNSKNSLELHQKFFHVSSSCSKCSKIFKNFEELANHNYFKCPKSLHYCKFCHLSLIRGNSTVESQYYNISAHEYQCGSKTIECYKCNKTVKKFDLESHLNMHELNKRITAKSMILEICKNINCCHVSVSWNNEYGLCNLCYGQFYTTDADLDGKKFYVKLERKYVIQLTRGCGFTHCKNTQCKSSGLIHFNHYNEIFKHIHKNLLNGETFWLCVDSLTTRNKLLANAYCEMYPSAYSLKWVYKALSQTGINNIADIDNWLKNNAISQNGT